MVKEGYKETDLDVIPEDWDIIELRKPLGHLEAGTSVNSSNDIQSTHRILKTSAIHGGIVDLNESKDVIPSDVCRLKCPVRQGSLIISRMNTPQLVGECGYVSSTRKDVYLPDRLWQTQNDEGYNYKWLNYLLNLPFYRNAVRAAATGTSNSMKNISKDDMYSISIPCPKIKEQNAIAEALSDIDALIDSLEKLIEKKKAIKQGAMQELLTGKIRLAGFSGKWNTVQIKEVCSFKNGGTPSKSRDEWWQGSIPWISSSDIQNNDIKNISITRHITQEAIDNSATKLCPVNSILVVSRVGVGKIAVAPCELCTSQDFTTLIPHKHDPFFLAYLLLAIMKEKSAQSQGTSIKGITATSIGEIEVPLPNLEEQVAIASILCDINLDIEALEKRLKKYRLIKAGMMAELLTGRIRLI